MHSPIRTIATGVAAAFVGLSSLSVVTSSAPASAADAGTSPCNPTAYTANSSAQRAVKWGSPAWRMCVGSTITESSPATFTYNGQTDLAIGDESGYVHILDAASGAELPGWPKRLAGGGAIAIESTPSIAYFNGPSGAPSIVVGAASTWVTNTSTIVEGFNIDGSTRFTFHVGRAAGTAVGVVDTPAIGDILGNGQQQVVFGSWDHRIYVLDAHGHQVGFAYDNADTIWSSPTLIKVAGNKGMDVIIGSDASGRTTPGVPGGTCKGGFIAEYGWSNSSIDPDTLKHGPGLTRTWFDCLNQVVWSSPTVTSIHGKPAVIVGTGFFEQPFPSDTSKLFAFYAQTGRVVPGWPVNVPGPVVGTPAIGAIAARKKAVVVQSFSCSGPYEADCGSTGRSQVTAFALSGKELWARTLLGPTAFGSPTMVPLQGGLYKDVLISTPNAMYPLDGATGALLFNTNSTNQFAAINPGCRSFSTPTVAQVTEADGSGTSAWDAFESCGGPPQFKAPGEVVAYRLPVQPPATA